MSVNLTPVAWTMGMGFLAIIVLVVGAVLTYILGSPFVVQATSWEPEGYEQSYHMKSGWADATELGEIMWMLIIIVSVVCTVLWSIGTAVEVVM